MALWHFTNLNKYGNPRSRIIHKPNGEAFSFNPNGFGSFVAVRRYKYEYEHPVMPPTILELNGKTYLMPLWKEVVKGTTVNDIEWIKPEPKVKQEPIVETSTSSSDPNKTYKTIYYPESGKFHCNCPGRWRAFDGKCKHIKTLEIKINK